MTQVEDTPASVTTPHLSATVPKDDPVTARLTARLDRLLGQDECDRLIGVQLVAPDTVREQSLEVLRKSPTSGMHRSAEAVLAGAEQVEAYKRVTAPVWVGALGVLLVAGVAAAVAYGVSDSAGLAGAVGAWVVLVLCWVPQAIRDRRRKESGLQNAPAQLALLEHDLDRRIRSLVAQATRDVVVPQFVDPDHDVVRIEDGTHLSSRAEQVQRVDPPARARIETHLLRAGGTAVGVTGERGVGKSEMLRSFSDDAAERPTVEDGGTIGVLVPIPAAFDGIQFLTLVLRRLADAVPGRDDLDRRDRRWRRNVWFLPYVLGAGVTMLAAMGLLLQATPEEIRDVLGSAEPGRWVWAPVHFLVPVLLAGAVLAVVSLRRATHYSAQAAGRPDPKREADQAYLVGLRRAAATNAAALVERLRWVETISIAQEGSLNLGKLGLKHTRRRSLSALPRTETDLVDEFRALTEGLKTAGYRVVVCVDEMDKLDDGTATESFLNSVKQLFAVPSCSFVVSVSSSAWSRFVRRGVELRGALDSTLDAVETIGPLEFVDTRSLLRHRHDDVTDTQALLCHVLAGGLPREILRSARCLARANQKVHGECMLAAAATDMIDDQITALVQASLEQTWRFTPPVRERTSLALTALSERWREERDAHCGARRSDPDPEADELLDRLRLFLAFFRHVETRFRAGSGFFGRGWEDVVAEAEALAQLRRTIEGSTSMAWRALQQRQAR